MNVVQSLFLALFSLAVGGCISHTYTPTIGALGSVPEFSSTQPISLQNAQPSAADVIVLSSWQAKWHANLQECTEVVRSMIERELTGRGITLDTGAPKSLRLSVESLKTDEGFATIVTEAVLSAETSSGYSIPMWGSH